MAIGSAAFTITSNFDNAQIQASVDRLNASVAATVKDVKIGSELDQAKLDAVLADATAKVAKASANVKIGADVQTAQIDAAIAKARVQIAALGTEAGAETGSEFSTSFRDIAFSPAVIGTAAGVGLALLPGVFAAAGAAGAVALGAAFAVKGSAELQQQGKSLVSGLESTVESAASVLVKPLSDAFTSLKGELPTLKSLLSTTFSVAAPLVSPLASMLTSIVNGALPGFNSLLKQAQGPLETFFTDSGKIIGTGLGKFFADLGPGAQGSLAGIEALEKGALGLADVLAKVASATGQVIQVGKQLTTVNPQLAQAGKALKIPDGNKNIFQAAGDAFSWLEKHLPAGNKTLLDLAAGTDKVTAGAARVGPALQTALTPTQQLAQAMSTAAGDTTKLDSAWNILVGNFAGEQASIIAAKQAVQQYGQQVKQSGASSLAAQGQFFSAVQSIGQMVDAETKNHAPAAQLYADIESQIGALKSKGPLNDAEKQALAGLQKAADGVAQSNTGLTKTIQQAAAAIEGQFNAQIQGLESKLPQVKTDVGGLANAILNTGDQSQATADARQQLISDLEKAGATSSQAKSLVNALQQQIDALKGKVVKVDADTAAAVKSVTTFESMLAGIGNKTVQISANVSVGGSQLAIGLLNGSGALAAGGVVGAANGIIAGGGPAGKDSQLILAAPGELVIPTSHAAEFGDLARRAGIPGFSGNPAAHEPAFGALSVPYSYAENGPEYVAPASAVQSNDGLPNMTRQQGAQVIQLLQTIAKQGQQAPYNLGQALNQAGGNGVRRGWFQTGG